jgi:hypothetical protein
MRRRVNPPAAGNDAAMALRSRPIAMRRTRVLGADRIDPGADIIEVESAPMPPVAQVGAVRTGAARRHLAGLNRYDRAQPASTGSGVAFLMLVMVLGVAVLLVLAATGSL